MSRVGKSPVALPAGVSVALTDEQISIAGPLGQLVQRLPSSVRVEHAEGALCCAPVSGAANAHPMSGTLRALINNMVIGVTRGFERRLLLVGVGYRAQAQGDKLTLSLGFSHPVVHQMPDGVKVETPQQTEVIIKGIDKQRVGQVAAEIRAYRPPEPYKGKGVRYADEHVVIKETKKK
ncbi:MAG TPA: 50S ribosomal protein L6 [Rhodocyclaceae bacterium]|nr:50S ribosomal protein L6 [Rhodocyclaceae bacterium]